MGGRGSRSGGMGGGSNTNGSTMTSAQANRLIERTSFTDEGGGQWTLDIPGVGGGSILDERDSSRAGFGSGPAYSISVWDGNYNRVDDQTILYGSLNDAKRTLKDMLKGLNR